MLHIKQFHWSQVAWVQIPSVIRLCVHIVQHTEAHFKAFAPQNTRRTTSVSWTHSRLHLWSYPTIVWIFWEFSSWAFKTYSMALRTEVLHSIPYIHTHNGLAESLNKRTKLVARPLSMKCSLPTSRWSHTVLHTADWLINCNSHYFPSAFDTWKSSEHFPSA